MLLAGADVNAGDYDQRTALHVAAADGNLAAVKVLVEGGGARLDVKDRWEPGLLGACLGGWGWPAFCRSFFVASLPLELSKAAAGSIAGRRRWSFFCHWDPGK